MLVLLAALAPYLRKTVSADMPEPYALFLRRLAGRVHLLRTHRGECNRAPGIGPIAAALSHADGFPTYPAGEEDRRLMEDVLTALEGEPEHAHRVPALRARMAAHYADPPPKEAPHG